MSTLTVQEHITVRLVRKGESYGLAMKMVHTNEEPLVEFYDQRRLKSSRRPLGQFISRYFVWTILEGPGGLLLDTGSPDWSLTSETMHTVRTWLRSQLTQ